MLRSKARPRTSLPTRPSSSVWQKALGSVFGAAYRLHQYRDARDVLLQRVLHEHETGVRQETCCGEHQQ